MKAKPETTGVTADAVAAYQASLHALAEARGRAATYRTRVTDAATRAKSLRLQHAEAIKAAVAVLDAYIAGEANEQAVAEAERRAEALDIECRDAERLALKLAEAPPPDLSKLYRNRDDCREWLSLALVQELAGGALAELKAAAPQAFAAWELGRPSARQWPSHGESERLWKIFTASLLPPCPDQPTIEAAKAALAARFPELATG